MRYPLLPSVFPWNLLHPPPIYLPHPFIFYIIYHISVFVAGFRSFDAPLRNSRSLSRFLSPISLCTLSPSPFSFLRSCDIIFFARDDKVTLKKRSFILIYAFYIYIFHSCAVSFFTLLDIPRRWCRFMPPLFIFYSLVFLGRL